MRNKEIKDILIHFFDTLLKDFKNIGIKYEYSKQYECYISSIDVENLTDETLELFCEVYLNEIKKIQNQFGDDAPLFCLNEEWFTLSSEAISYYFHDNSTKPNLQWIEDSEISSKFKIHETSYAQSRNLKVELLIAA